MLCYYNRTSQARCSSNLVPKTAGGSVDPCEAFMPSPPFASAVPYPFTCQASGDVSTTICAFMSKDFRPQWYYDYAKLNERHRLDLVERKKSYPLYVSKAAHCKPDSFGFRGLDGRFYGYGATFFMSKMPVLVENGKPIECFGAAYFRPANRYGFGQCYPANPKHEWMDNVYGIIRVSELMTHCPFNDSARTEGDRLLKIICFNRDFTKQIVAYLIQAGIN